MPPRPGGGSRWYKAHGLGNDYLVFEEGEAWSLVPRAVQAVCHRTRGLGSDGIVLRLRDSESGVQRLRMFNPDGSEFERSGNGLRIFGAYRAFRDEVGSEPFEIEVGGDRVRLQVLERKEGGVFDVSVAMGEARFGPEAVGSTPGAVDDLGLQAVAGDLEGIELVPVSVGNPHAVVFLPELTESLLEELGPHLSAHPAFPRGVNVQLARAEPPDRLRMLVWERGVGRTSASGTSSCAAAAAAVHTGRLEPGEIEVKMEGGSLQVTVTRDYRITLRGPVQAVGSGELDPGFVAALPDPSTPS